MASKESLDDSFATAAFLVEKETGAKLTPEYPALKFVTQLEEIQKYYKKQNDEYNKSQSGKTMGGRTLG
jgi:hypothetical protein